MLPGMELMGCTDLAVPADVMRHVVQVESSFNPYAIGVVGGRLARQPRSLNEALVTARALESAGRNFSLGLAQVNKHNFVRQGLHTHERAFDPCANLRAGARILAECHQRADGDWGKAFSCYYSGNFTTGYAHGYVQKVMDAWQAAGGPAPIPFVPRAAGAPAPDRITRRIEEAGRARPRIAWPDPGSRAPGGVADPAADVDRSPHAPTSPDARAAAATSGDPVIVQPTAQPRAAAPPPSGTSQPPDAPPPDRDAAFVF